MAAPAKKGFTSFALTKCAAHACFRSGKTAKERENGKLARHINNLAERAAKQAQAR